MPTEPQARINGSALRKARQAAGYTQRGLARKAAEAGVPVNNSNIAKAENHGYGLGPRRLAVILRLLPGLSPDNLIPGLDDEMRTILSAPVTDQGRGPFPIGQERARRKSTAA
jgi:transcriptional regulator with XRE-family HTH domain